MAHPAMTTREAAGKSQRAGSGRAADGEGWATPPALLFARCFDLDQSGLRAGARDDPVAARELEVQRLRVVEPPGLQEGRGQGQGARVLGVRGQRAGESLLEI